MNGKIFKSENKRLNCVAHQFYKEYMQFMNFNEEPIFKSYYSKSGLENNALAKTINPDAKNPFYRILASQKIKNLNSNSQKAFLYHEFTHIKDQIVAEKIFDKSATAKSKSFFYSEFHASKVETMVLLGFNNYDEHRTITLNDKLYYEDDKELSSIETFLSKQREKEIYNFKVRVDHYNTFYKPKPNNENNKELYDILSKEAKNLLQGIMYYLGHLELFVEIKQLDDFKDLTPFYQILENESVKDELDGIYFNLHNHAEIEEEALNEIGKLQIQMFQKIGAIP